MFGNIYIHSIFKYILGESPASPRDCGGGVNVAWRKRVNIPLLWGAWLRPPRMAPRGKELLRQGMCGMGGQPASCPARGCSAPPRVLLRPAPFLLERSVQAVPGSGVAHTPCKSSANPAGLCQQCVLCVVYRYPFLHV